VCLLALLALASAAVAQSPLKTNLPPKLTLQEGPLAREVKAATSFAPVIRRVAPSVVNIYSTMTIHERPMMSPFFNDPWLRRFFGGQFAPRDR